MKMVAVPRENIKRQMRLIGLYSQNTYNKHLIIFPHNAHLMSVFHVLARIFPRLSKYWISFIYRLDERMSGKYISRKEKVIKMQICFHD